jgi:hypothetical protein
MFWQFSKIHLYDHTFWCVLAGVLPPPTSHLLFFFCFLHIAYGRFATMADIHDPVSPPPGRDQLMRLPYPLPIRPLDSRRQRQKQKQLDQTRASTPRPRLGTIHAPSPSPPCQRPARSPTSTLSNLHIHYLHPRTTSPRPPRAPCSLVHPRIPSHRHLQLPPDRSPRAPRLRSLPRSALPVAAPPCPPPFVLGAWFLGVEIHTDEKSRDVCPRRPETLVKTILTAQGLRIVGHRKQRSGCFRREGTDVVYYLDRAGKRTSFQQKGPSSSIARELHDWVNRRGGACFLAWKFGYFYFRE